MNALALAALAIPAASFVLMTAQEPSAGDIRLMPIGDEFQVNTYTTGIQDSPRIAVDRMGSATIAWSSFGQDGDAQGVFAQRYDITGVPTGSEWRINVTTSGSQFASDVKQTLFNTKLYINFTWTGPDADGPGSYFQQYVDGAPISATDLPGNTQTDGIQQPSSTFLTDRGPTIHGGICFEGSALVSSGSDVFCAVGNYDSNPYQTGSDAVGNPIRPSGLIPPEFQVNTYTTGYQGRPASCGLPNGEFVVSWVSFGQNPNGSSIHSRLVDVDTGVLGSEFEVSSNSSANADYPTNCCSDNGFVVAWDTFGVPFQSFDGDSSGVAAQRYDLAGQPVGTEFRVNEVTMGAQYNSSVACDSAGNFVVVWSGSDGAKGRAFDANGAALTDETHLSDSFFGPVVGLDDNGTASVAWALMGADFSQFNIVARRFTIPGLAGTTTTLAPTTTIPATTTTTLTPTTTTVPGTTTTTMPMGGGCGDAVDPPVPPLTSDDAGVVTASDALLALKAAVGLESCALCVCDVDDTGNVTAADALRILNAAVGVPVVLMCPACT